MDLRFLDGRPVRARRAGPLGRAWRLGRRHPRMATLLLLAFSAVLTAAGIALRERYLSGQRAAWAEHFGRQTQVLASRADLAHLQPAHDLEPVYGSIDRQLVELRESVSRLDPTLAGAGRAAIGMAELRLGRLPEAIRELEQAWNHGHRAAEVALALGNAYSELYQRRIGEARLLREDLRTAAVEVLERELATKVRYYLGQARAASSGSEIENGTALSEARMAAGEGHLDRALELARLAQRQSPYLADSFRFEGEILTAMADRSYRNASRPDSALALAEQASKALERAQDRARSDPRVAQARCDLATLRIALAAAEKGAIEKALGRLESICRETSYLLSDRPDPWLRVIDAGTLAYRRIARLGHHPLLPLDLTRNALRQARRASPEHAGVLAAAADVAGIEVSFAADFRGEDPYPFCARPRAPLAGATCSS